MFLLSSSILIKPLLGAKYGQGFDKTLGFKAREFKAEILGGTEVGPGIMETYKDARKTAQAAIERA